MPFPGRSPSAAPTPPAGPGAPPAPPAGPGAPPAPPAAPARKFWCFINGASVLKPEAEARALPPETQAQNENLAGGWQTLGALLGAAPAGAPAPVVGARSAFGQRAAPAVQQPAAQSGPPRSVFAGVENAEVFRKNAYIFPGNYVARLCSSEYKTGRQKNQVINELEVLVSSYRADDASTSECNREGTRMTNFVQHNDSFMSNMKEIMLAVSGFDANGKARDLEDTVEQAECDALVSPEQPYAGAIVYLEAREVPTKAGGLFTRVSWWPCPLKTDGTPDLERLSATR